MADTKIKTTDNSNALENFNWDEDDTTEFFGIKGSGTKTTTTAEDVLREMDKEDEEDGTAAKIDDEEEKPKKKKKGEAEEEEEEEINEDNAKFFEAPEEKPKEKVKKEAKAEAVEEDEEEEEEDEEEDEKEKPKEKIKKEEGKDKKKETEAAEPKSDGEFFKTLASELKEKGIFQHVEIPEDKKELEEEEFFDLHDQEIEGRVNETFEAFAEEMDDDGKAFIKFKKNGGRTQDFHAVYLQSPVPDFGDKEFDSANEKHRKQSIYNYLKYVDAMDEEEISDRMEWLKEQGKDKAYAEKYYNKLVEIDSNQKAKLLKDQEDKVKEREEKAKKFVKGITEVINKTDTVGEFKITKEDKKLLTDTITRPTVKIGKNKYIPKFNFKLGEILEAKTPEAKQKLVLLAKLVETDFDISDLVTKVETKVVQKVKSKLRDAKNGVKPSSSGRYDKKSLSDFFND